MRKFKYGLIFNSDRYSDDILVFNSQKRLESFLNRIDSYTLKKGQEFYIDNILKRIETYWYADLVLEKIYEATSEDSIEEPMQEIIIDGVCYDSIHIDGYDVLILAEVDDPYNKY